MEKSQFHPEASLFSLLIDKSDLEGEKKNKCNHNFYGMKRAFGIKSFGSDWKKKINIWMSFVLIFVPHFVDFFIPKAIERKDEVIVNQTNNFSVHCACLHCEFSFL